MARTLVTGGAGYFGSLLVRRLAGAGHAVRVFDLELLRDSPLGVESIAGDIRDRDAVERACAGMEIVHHNVAQVPLAKDPEAFWSVNRDGTRVLLAACFAGGVRKVVHMSSSAVYGVPEKNPVDESTPPRPGEEYGRAKLAAEQLCQEYAALGLDVTIVRPRTILGHGRLGILQLLFEWIRRGDPVPVLDGGSNIYQFVHADDLAQACERAAERPGAGEYNIGTDRFCTMLQTLRGLIAHAGTGSRVVSLPMAPAEILMNLTSSAGLSPLGAYHALMYGRSLYFDVGRAQRELGYTPVHDNVSMIVQSYEWYLEHRDDVLGMKSLGSPHRRAVEPKILAWLPWFLRWLPDAG